MNRELKNDVIFYCQRMDLKGWVANHDGNVSVRLSAERFLVTPSGVPKFKITERDLLEVNLGGEVLSGHGKVFSEWAYHARAYQARSDVRAVVHAHPVCATAVGCTGQEIGLSALPEAVVSLGAGVPCVPLHVPGNTEGVAMFAKLSEHYQALLVGGNGVFAWGVDLEQAFLRVELVEHAASIFFEASRLGSTISLEKAAVAELLAKRAKAGLDRPADPDRKHWFP